MAERGNACDLLSDFYEQESDSVGPLLSISLSVGGQGKERAEALCLSWTVGV
jgi:hypothetical protein